MYSVAGIPGELFVAIIRGGNPDLVYPRISAPGEHAT
jgi:hypothetical protein